MTLADYVPLLIMPLAGLIIAAVVWASLLVERRKQHRHHTPAE
jgi:hypothetical protein